MWEKIGMRVWCIIFFALSVGISCGVFGVGIIAKHKYPNVLLTKDYDILNENDLASHTWEMKPEPFSEKEGSEYNYWQCFSRDRVIITLKDMGFSSEDIGWDDNYGDLTIKVWLDGGIYHEYFMRRRWGVDGGEDIFNWWRKLMRNEKSVCLAGRFSHYKDVIQSSTKRRTYYWTFEKIKTKKGCDSYFAGQCDLTYKKFLQEHGRMK